MLEFNIGDVIKLKPQYTKIIKLKLEQPYIIIERRPVGRDSSFLTLMNYLTLEIISEADYSQDFFVHV
jgi:hypothetical protein